MNGKKCIKAKNKFYFDHIEINNIDEELIKKLIQILQQI